MCVTAASRTPSRTLSRSAPTHIFHFASSSPRPGERDREAIGDRALSYAHSLPLLSSSRPIAAVLLITGGMKDASPGGVDVPLAPPVLFMGWLGGFLLGDAARRVGWWLWGFLFGDPARRVGWGFLGRGRPCVVVLDWEEGGHVCGSLGSKEWWVFGASPVPVKRALSYAGHCFRAGDFG